MKLNQTQHSSQQNKAATFYNLGLKYKVCWCFIDGHQGVPFPTSMKQRVLKTFQQCFLPPHPAWLTQHTEMKKKWIYKKHILFPLG